jgi:hypothetical protein
MEIRLPEQWQGDIPVFLLIMRDEQPTVIDLDERGWLETYKELLRGESTWHLVDRESHGICFSLVVLEGEQPYYVARHFARASLIGGEQQAHVAAYGIGKKRLDGHVDRLWVFWPSRQICAGDDVDILGKAALDSL